MQNESIRPLADLLFQAESTSMPIPPLTQQHPALTLDDAYAIQLCNVQFAQTLGYEVSGKKIGLTSEGIQTQLGVNEPDYGHLFAAMDRTGKTVDTDRLIQPKIEAEIAFFLKKNLSGGRVTVADVYDATEWVAPAFEIVDSRIHDWKIQLIDTVADNASSGRYILGKRHLPPSHINLPAESMVLCKNGMPLARGNGAAVLGNPCAAVAWLANRLWSYGVPLQKGEVILSGAFSAAPPAEKGDYFTAEFSTLGNVTARFA